VKRYSIRTIPMDVGSVRVEFPYHDEDDCGAWVRYEEAQAEIERMRAVVEAADRFVMDDVRAVPDLFNEMRAALWAMKKAKEAA
jgi:hypothetical protein